jgi:phosphoglycerate dehydrogenase-like enzyme
VVALPHTAGNTHQGAERMLRDAIDQIGQLSRGEKLTHLLDPGAWPGRAGKV